MQSLALVTRMPTPSSKVTERYSVMPRSRPPSYDTQIVCPWVWRVEIIRPRHLAVSAGFEDDDRAVKLECYVTLVREGDRHGSNVGQNLREGNTVAIKVRNTPCGVDSCQMLVYKRTKCGNRGNFRYNLYENKF